LHTLLLVLMLPSPLCRLSWQRDRGLHTLLLLPL
jgi:hypothetical protein